MKSDQQKPATDSTEKWLDQIIGDYCPEAPANAWQRLEQHLPQRKRRRPLAFWLSTGVVVVAAAISIGWFLKNSEALATPTGSVEKGQLIVQASAGELSENLKKKKAAILIEKPEVATSAQFSKNHFSSKYSLEGGPVLAKYWTHETPVKSTFLKNEEHEARGFLEKTIAATHSFLEKTAPTKDLYLLEKLSDNTFPTVLLSENPRSELQFPTPLIKPIKYKVPRYRFGFEAAPVFIAQKNKGKRSGNLIFPEAHPRPGHGFQAGVSLFVEPLKKWRVGIIIQHLRQTHEAAHSATLRLMDGVCLNPHDPGLKEYQFHYTVVSGDKQSDLTLRLQQEEIGSTMPVDEPFTLDMKTAYHSASWRVPFTVERKFGAGKWHGFVRGGAVVDFSEKTKIKVTHFTEACQDLCFHSGHLPTISSSSPSKTELGWLAGVGFEREVSRGTALRVEPFVVGRKGLMQCGLSVGLLFLN
ncbi:MAG: hypothetical protein IPM48_08560 [Saprospiraceae bacterium]|nr:hypothetical protein [Saprospiraceae bacterium]